jgi:hypothetical protein
VPFRPARLISAFLVLLTLHALTRPAEGEPTPAAVSTFNGYIAALESRLVHQHSPGSVFLAPAGTEARLRQGEFIIDKLTPADTVTFSGAMLHHWRGTAFVPGATAADFERLMEDFNAYPHVFAPEVVQAKLLGQQDTHDAAHFQAMMRVRQKHVLTVVMDTTYDVAFAQLDPRHRYSLSRSTNIAEIDAPGTPNEHPLGPGEDHGFLWRLNSYWSIEERDGGLYMQVESVSLTRSIPTGLAWAVGPFVESVPRESLEFTLRSASNALRKP